MLSASIEHIASRVKSFVRFFPHPDILRSLSGKDKCKSGHPALNPGAAVQIPQSHSTGSTQPRVSSLTWLSAYSFATRIAFLMALLLDLP